MSAEELVFDTPDAEDEADDSAADFKDIPKIRTGKEDKAIARGAVKSLLTDKNIYYTAAK